MQSQIMYYRDQLRDSNIPDFLIAFHLIGQELTICLHGKLFGSSHRMNQLRNDEATILSIVTRSVAKVQPHPKQKV